MAAIAPYIDGVRATVSAGIMSLHSESVISIIFSFNKPAKKKKKKTIVELGVSGIDITFPWDFN